MYRRENAVLLLSNSRNQKPSRYSDNGQDMAEDPNTSLDESDETDASMSDDSWMDYFDLDEGKEPERSCGVFL